MNNTNFDTRGVKDFQYERKGIEKECVMEIDNKEIVINSDSLVSDIQREFSTCYPFLKIEFHVPNNKGKSRRNTLIDPGISVKRLADINLVKINISSNRSVAEVSHDLGATLGVIVQVLRKSGNVWSTISISDGWTLKSQNTAGEYISSEMMIKAIDPSV